MATIQELDNRRGGCVSPPRRRYPQIRFEAPPGATELLLVRHGESQAADPDRPFPFVDGRGDPELSPLGREQAVLVADRLAATRVDAIYVTSLRRTAETAAPLAARLGLVPTVEPALAEVRLGEWDGGIYRQRVAEGDPVVLQMVEEERWDVIPGAESNAAIAARVGPAITRIAQRHPGRACRVLCPRRHDWGCAGDRDRVAALSPSTALTMAPSRASWWQVRVGFCGASTTEHTWNDTTTAYAPVHDLERRSAAWDSTWRRRGSDPCSDLPVQVALVRWEPYGGGSRNVFIVDPGCDVPAGAEAIHGISTERARHEGCPSARPSAIVHAALGKAQDDHVPVVAMNASFDVTIAAMLFRSFALEPIEWRALVDPLVIDRKVDCLRSGKRRLDALCETYDVVLGIPHDAGSDADATLALARTIACRYPKIAEYEIGELTRLQADWHRAWALEYDSWCRENGEPGLAPEDFFWPMREVLDLHRRAEPLSRLTTFDGHPVSTAAAPP